MKKAEKILSIILAVVMILSAFPFVGASASSDDFIIDENGVLTAYNGAGGDIVIPDGVVAIADSVFAWNMDIINVVFPDGLERIGNRAFWDCDNLKSVTIPVTLTTIGESGFCCNNFDTVYYPCSMDECTVDELMFPFTGPYVVTFTYIQLPHQIVDGKCIICEENEHIHSFLTDWAYNKTGHWHKCTASKCDIKDYSTCGLKDAAYGLHSFADGICTVCGAKEHIHSFSSEWTCNVWAHWHECTNPGCNITDYSTCGFKEAAYGSHDFLNGTCTQCGYKDPMNPSGHKDNNKDNLCDKCGAELYVSRGWDETRQTLVETYEEIPSGAEKINNFTSVLYSDRWYYADGTVEISTHVSVNSINGEPVRVILKDGCSLTASQGIILDDSDGLCIYGQSKDNGVLLATGHGTDAGIGGASGSRVTVFGGEVAALGGDEGGAGIGGNQNCAGGEFTICGGEVIVQGGYCAAGIGGGDRGAGSDFTIYGGKVTAMSDGGAGIGGGFTKINTGEFNVKAKADIKAGFSAEDLEYSSVSKYIAERLPYVVIDSVPVMKIKYIDKSFNINEAGAVRITETDTVWKDSFMFVRGDVEIADTVDLQGDVNIILEDNSSLVITGGINSSLVITDEIIAPRYTLTVYGQMNNTGNLTVYGTDAKKFAGMVGNMVAYGGNTVIKGGNPSEESHAYVGGFGIDGSLTVCGGTVTAQGGEIGYENEGSTVGGAGLTGNLTVTGGTAKIRGGAGGPSYYTGAAAGVGVKGNVEISGGTALIYGGNGSPGYYTGGDGGCGVDGTVKVRGGEITVSGGSAGTGGGSKHSGAGGNGVNGTVNVSDGKFTAIGGSSISYDDGYAAESLVFDGLPVIKAGDNEQSATVVSEYNGEHYLKVEYISEHIHSFTSEVYIDNGDGTHSQKCTDCDEYGTAENHIFVDGACICGAKIKPDCEIISVTEVTEPAVGSYVTLEFLIAKPVAKLQFVTKNGNTFTYSATSGRTISIVNNDDGTQTWQVEIMVYRQSDTYSLHIKDAKTGWSDNYYEYTLADTHDYKAVVTSCELPPEITEGAAIKAGQHDIVIKTNKDVTKVQFVYNGETATYTPSSARAKVVEEDDCLVWTISQNFYVIGEGITYNVKTRTATTSFEDSGISFTVSVTR